VRPDGSVGVVAPAVASQPTFSPDGQRVVVVAAEGDYESAGPDSTSLLAVGLDGADPVAVTPVGDQVDAPSWSPGGSAVAFVRHDLDRRRDEIVVVGADGSAPRSIVTLGASLERARAVAWSPDGDRLAFVGSVDTPDGSSTTYTLWVVAADGSGLREVAEIGEAVEGTFAGTEGSTLDWAGSGDRVLVSDAGIETRPRLVDVATGRVDELDGQLASARWSRGGTHVVGVRHPAAGGAQVVEAPLDGTALGPPTVILDTGALGDIFLTSSVAAGLDVAPCAA
jgi:dipeptidyl aminopeptidase/acylaminoacyl peptidase